MSQEGAVPPRPADQQPTEAALRFVDVRKHYGRTCALNGVTFDVRPGRIHTLLGGNGSGKSTLIKILAGVESGLGKGTIGVGDSSISDDKTTPEWARDNGIAFVHQDLGLFENLTVAENLVAGAAFPHYRGVVRWKTINSHAEALLAEFGLDVRPRQLVQSLRPAQKTLVAVARALGVSGEQRARILVLDEPTASLPPTEANRLLDALVDFRGRGYAIVYVTHRLDEVLAFGDWVTVLRDGNVVADQESKELQKSDLVELIAGRRLDSVMPERRRQVEARPVLEVKNLSGGPLSDVTLTVNTGEVVGIAGLVGAGRSSLLQCIFGLHRHSGTIQVDGQSTGHGASKAIRCGLAYVPEDRALDGTFSDLPVSTNVVAGHDELYFRSGRYKRRSERAFAGTVIERLAVRTPSPDVPIASLSGGNQQKLVLGRWLRPDTKLLLLDEPTQGVDVGARADIYRQIGELRDNGLGIVLVSSDDEELLGLADRVFVLRGGRVATERARNDITHSWLSHAVHGLAYETEDTS